jgi:small multidrug resistance pump
MRFVYLSLAIASEVIGTTALKATEGFSKLIPSAVVVLSYSAAFYFLSICLDKISVGVAYAVWSGLGIVLVTVVAAFVTKQIPDGAAVLGMGLIVAGVLVLNLCSNSASH